MAIEQMCRARQPWERKSTVAAGADTLFVRLQDVHELTAYVEHTVAILAERTNWL